MNYDQFFEEATKLQLRPPVEAVNAMFRSSLDNEALFQLPLLAMVILTLSAGRKKPKTAELGQLVGECLERTVAGFKGSSQGIGWSANLRIRTVKALTFLERTHFISIDERSGRIAAEDIGRKVLADIYAAETPLTHALSIVERSYENINAERLIGEEV